MSNLSESILDYFEFDKNVQCKVYSLLNLLKQPFENVSTEYKRKKYFQQHRYYIPPQPSSFGYELAVKKNKNKRRTFKNFAAEGQYVPITTVLKMFLKNDDNYQKIKSFMNKLELECVLM